MRLARTHLRKAVLALVFIGLSLFLLIRHRQIEDQGSLRWYDRATLFLTSPVERFVVTVRGNVRLLAGRYIFLVRVEKENEALQKKTEEFRSREVLERGVVQENDRLRRELDLKNRENGDWLVAKVISCPPVGPYRVLTIDKGSEEGVTRSAPVISPDGLVGQVARVTANESEVLLVTDPTSAVDGRIEKTEARGLVVGKVLQLGMDRALFISAFEYLNRSAGIEEGAAVVTSGLDGVYPPGILIGYAHQKQGKKQDIFQQADVVPAADFYRLSEVLVMKKRGD